MVHNTAIGSLHALNLIKLSYQKAFIFNTIIAMHLFIQMTWLDLIIDVNKNWVVAKQTVLKYLKDYPLIINRLSLYELSWFPRWTESQFKTVKMFD